MMIVDGLANKNKWGQLDTFVRKYRLLNSADSLKNFASTMSIVPMLRDSSLQNSEDMKLQILKTMIGGGATLGSDGRCTVEGTDFNWSENLQSTTHDL